MTAFTSYFNDIYRSVSSAMIGMRITIRQMVSPTVTLQYPHVKKQMSDRVRNRLYMNFDDCIGCELCAKACPVDCIDIEVMKAPPTEERQVVWEVLAQCRVDTRYDDGELARLRSVGITDEAQSADGQSAVTAAVGSGTVMVTVRWLRSEILRVGPLRTVQFVRRGVHHTP